MSAGRGFPYKTGFFIASAVALLVIGLVAGAWLTGARLVRSPPPQALNVPPNRALEGMIGALPEAEAAAMREKFRSAYQASGTQRREQAEARRAAARVLLAERYDQEAARAALDRIRAADDTAARAVNATMAEALAGLTVEQRRAAVRAWTRARWGQQLRERLGRGPGGPGSRGGTPLEQGPAGGAGETPPGPDAPPPPP